MTKQPLNKEFIMNATIDNFNEFEKSLKKAQSTAIALFDAIEEINKFIPQLSVSELDKETISNSESDENKLDDKNDSNVIQENHFRGMSFKGDPELASILNELAKRITSY
ncbi:hypothetical protein [Fructobacillus papyrifericola]|uniref:Uncharacterized protein n=1 Tax=Fructobacillus papyrifericola TaxID=2713172 RepID=A0ABS5QU30_9LACO|nr:hypothetical protein [Fructobacillus papyrifericola]MBS9336442.1 hypothetical protein [Fructobacillus papyrifericola]